MIRHFDRQSTRIVNRQAAYVAGFAKQSISRKKKTSSPGKPPRSPTGRLRNSIIWSRVAPGVAAAGARRLRHGNVTRALEKGGTAKFFSRRGGFKTSGYQRVKARPFMLPALQRAVRTGRLRKAMEQVIRTGRRY